MQFCPNYRDVRRLIKRTVIRRILFVVILILLCEIGNGMLHAYSIYDRRRIHGEQTMNRTMLDARARIQIVLIKTGTRRAAFTEAERTVICENWDAAEYAYVEGVCPE
jgi:hypothetical protein